MAVVQKEDTETVGVSEENNSFFGHVHAEAITVTEDAALARSSLSSSDFEGVTYVRVVNPFNYVQLYRED